MFSTKGQEVKTGGGIPKSLQPGVVYAHIHSSEVRVSKNTGKKALEFILEGPSLDNFEGWSITRGDDNGPKFKGQSSRVMATMWTDQHSDTNISKNEILYKLSVIAQELGLVQEVGAINATTIEDWVAQATRLVAGHNLYFFIKGNEEEYEGKTRVKLSLPKFKFASADESKLDTFDKNNQYHYKALANKAVNSFEPATDDFEM